MGDSLLLFLAIANEFYDSNKNTLNKQIKNRDVKKIRHLEHKNFNWM